MSYPLRQRYFVLAESSTEFCVLRIYYKVVESSWGTIPLKKKSSIPIGTVRSVAPISTKIKQGEEESSLMVLGNMIVVASRSCILLRSSFHNYLHSFVQLYMFLTGKQFSVTFKIFDGEKASPSPSGLLTRSRRGSDATLGSRPGEGSELGEGDSDGERDGNDNSRSKSMILKAEDLKVRLSILSLGCTPMQF